MRKYFGLCGLLISSACLLASCLKDDDDDVTLYDDAAITTFQITSNSLSSYPFSIDQVNNCIWNADSLPYGTAVNKLLVSYSTKNNGTAYIENLTRDSLRLLSSTDSTDFSTARYVRVYPSNGSQQYRTYTVTVNVHKEQGDTLFWNKVASEDNSFSAYQDMRLVNFNNTLVLLATDGSHTYLRQLVKGTAATYSEVMATLSAAAYKNTAVNDSTLYLLDGTELKALSHASADLTTVASCPTLTRLLGATSKEMYAYNASGELCASTDKGLTWQADLTDDSATLLPTESVTLFTAPFKYGDNTETAFLVGSRDTAAYATDSTAMAWRKIVELDEGAETNEWIYVDYTRDCSYPLLRLRNLTVLPYGDKLIAFGAEGMGKCTAQPYTRIYESRDGGLTWKASAKLQLPADFDKTASIVAAATDDDNYIWIANGKGETWRGKLNNLSW